MCCCASFTFAGPVATFIRPCVSTTLVCSTTWAKSRWKCVVCSSAFSLILCCSADVLAAVSHLYACASTGRAVVAHNAAGHLSQLAVLQHACHRAAVCVVRPTVVPGHAHAARRGTIGRCCWIAMLMLLVCSFWRRPTRPVGSIGWLCSPAAPFRCWCWRSVCRLTTTRCWWCWGKPPREKRFIHTTRCTRAVVRWLWSALWPCLRLTTSLHCNNDSPATILLWPIAAIFATRCTNEPLLEKCWRSFATVRPKSRRA